MFPWLRLASDADWNIPTKRFEPEKGVDLYGRYMSKSGFLGQSYRPRLIRRVDLYAGIYGIYPTITLLLQLVAKDCIPCNGGAKNCTTALTPNLPTVIKLEMWTLCYNSLELLFKAGLQKRLLVIGCRPYCGFFFRASISNVATIDVQTLRD